MNTIKLMLAVLIGMLLVACGGGGGSAVNAPDAPTGVTVAAGTTAGTTATISFTAPSSDGGSAITGYTVTANPGGITASGAASPITLTGLVAGTAYTYSVIATNSAGNSAPTTTGLLTFYSIVETFHEPMTQPNDTIFTGSFTFDSINHTVSNLKGSLTEAMSGSTMTTVPLNYQLSAVSNSALGGLLVTTFALNTTDTFDGGGFAPGDSQYFGLSTGTPNNHNAYAMIFVNTTDPTAPLTQAQINKLAYADCTAGGMMMSSCMTGTTVDGYGATGTMDGYPVSQTITKIGALAQAITFGAAPTITVGGTGTVSATGGASGNAVTFTSSTTSVCTVSGNTVTGVAAGTCTIAANQAGNASYNAAAQVTQSITIGKADQIISGISFSPNTLSVGGTATVSASGGASGNPVVFTSTTPGICTVSGATVSSIAAGACIVAANQAGNSNYKAAAQATQTITTGAAAQVITFGTAPTITVGGTGTVTATGGASGNAVTFTSATGTVCSVSGSTVTGIAAGTCTIAANQAGNASYNTAAQVTQDITISKGNQSISFGTAPAVSVGGAGTVSATATSGLAVTYTSNTTSVCTVSGNTVTGVAAGTCTIAANQPGDANYNAATQATQNITIGKASQTISFGTAPAVSVGGTGTVSATATSGLAVTYTSTTTGVCAVTGSTVTGVAAGTCTIAANQAGNANYSAAAQVTQDITISKGNQTISFGTAPTLTLFSTSTVSATATSSLKVSYTSTSTDVCSVDSSTGLVTDLTIGICTIAANQAGDANYNAAPQAAQTITVDAWTGPVTAPGAPAGLTVTAGNAPNTAIVSIGQTSSGGSPITGYSVTASPDGITASGTASPITLTGLTAGTDYTFSVTALNSAGTSAAATVKNINTYNIVETFYEPKTQPRNTIFTGSFTYDSITNTVSNLTGSITESMKNPMTTVPLTYQLSVVSNPTLGGLLVTTFALNTTDVFSGGGFAPGGTTSFGNNNAYAMIFVNTTDPTIALTQAQINKLAYADCTPNGLMGMMQKCMTGTTVAGYGKVGTMGGYPEPLGQTPIAQVITKQ